MKVNVINSGINPLPTYAKAGDSGMDLRANFSNGLNEDYLFHAAFDDVRQTLLVFSGGRVLIPTGLYTSFPPGYELQIRPRSGTALKFGVTVLNTPGTIDSNYRGEIGIILMNLSDEVFEIQQGDRIAQAVLAKVSLIEWNVVEHLDKTERGDGAFNSTGVK